MKKLILINSFYLLVSILLWVIIRDSLPLMLGWNTILAFIPYFLSSYFDKIKSQKIMLYLLIILSVLFLPNTFYILTDFIHLQNYHFFNTITDYNYDLKLYLLLIHIIFAFFIGLIYGYLSLINFKKIIKKKYQEIIIFLISLLCGFGIYIGRFLRFNSWDILRPITLFKRIFASFNIFALGFTFTIGITIYFFYLGISLFIKNQQAH